MEKKLFTNLQKICMTAVSVLLAVMLLGTVIAMENAGAVNTALGAKTFEIVATEGADENADREYFKSDYSTLQEVIDAGRDMSEKIAAEGAALLKNANNALPLASGARKVTMFSYTSSNPFIMNAGSSQSKGAVAAAVSLEKGLTNAGMSVNTTLLNEYVKNKEEEILYGGALINDLSRPTSTSINDFSWNTINSWPGVTDSFAGFNDAAVFVIGRFSGEGGDLAVTGADGEDGSVLTLNENEKSLFEGVAAMKGAGAGQFKKIIVLLNTANQMNADFINNPAYKIDAALYIGLPGVSGANAVGKILTGEVNPSGSLADTWFNDYKDNPVHANYDAYQYGGSADYKLPDILEGQSSSMLGNAANYDKYVVYQEGIYMGYRYTETRYEDAVMQRAKTGAFNYNDVVAYPFGYGLSYTDFEYSNFNVGSSGSGRDRIHTVNVDVTNTGTVPGKEAVEIYVQKPYTDYDIANGIEKSAVDLVGFGKTGVLEAGATETVTVTVSDKELASYDANNAKTFIISEGTYYFAAGRDSHDALNNILARKGKTAANGMTADGNAELSAAQDRSFDNTTFSIASTGKKITNVGDEIDINKYSGKGSNSAAYISRNDWEGTVVLKNAAADGFYNTNNVKLTMTDGMKSDLSAQMDGTGILTPDDAAYPTMGVDSGLQLIDLRVDSEGNAIAYDDPVWDVFLDQMTWDELSYICSTGLRKTGMLERLGKPETKDHNGCCGLAEYFRLGQSGLTAKAIAAGTIPESSDPNALYNAAPAIYANNAVVAGTLNPVLMEDLGKMQGNEALWAGYNALYGFGVNMHRTPFAGRNAEYYSEDGFLTGMTTAYMVKGIQAKGCPVYMKHFALGSQERQRIGISTWCNEQALREIHLKAFELPIVESNAMNVMTAFNRVGLMTNPASTLVKDWLRGECGLEGLIVTDMFSQLKGAVMPVMMMAGTNIPDGDNDASKFYEPFKEGYGELAWEMRDAAHRIMYVASQFNAMNGLARGFKIVKVTPGWQIALITVTAILGAMFVGCLAWMVIGAVLKKRKGRAAA